MNKTGVRAMRGTVAALAAVAVLLGVAGSMSRTAVAPDLAVTAYSVPVEHNGTLAVASSSKKALTFTISATAVTGLYPGANVNLNLTLVNPNKQDLRISALSGELVQTSKSGCQPTSRNLVVAGYGGSPSLPYRLKGGKSAKVGHLRLTMPNTVVNACQGATFTIKLTGSATVEDS